MKYIICSICVLLIWSVSAAAQTKPLSPPQTVSSLVDGVKVSIEYNSPSVRGRTVWGGLEKYDKVWRTGANEATRISFDQDVKIEGQDLKAGTYSLFSIPSEGDWTIIFNTVPNQWGAYSYNEEKDALRVKVSPLENEHTEAMTFVIKHNTISLRWDKISVPFAVYK